MAVESASFEPRRRSARPVRTGRGVEADIRGHVPGGVSATLGETREHRRKKARPATIHEDDRLIELRSELKRRPEPPREWDLSSQYDDVNDALPSTEGMRVQPRREVGWGVRKDNRDAQSWHKALTWDYGRSEMADAPRIDGRDRETTYWSNTYSREHRLGKIDDDFAHHETETIELANAMADLFGVRMAKKMLERVLKTGLERDVIPMNLAVKQALAERLVSCPPLEKLVEEPYHKQIQALLPAFRALYRGEALGSDKTPTSEHVPEDWAKTRKQYSGQYSSQNTQESKKKMGWKDQFYADLDQAYLNRERAKLEERPISEEDAAVIWLQNQGGAQAFERYIELYVQAPAQVPVWVESFAGRYPEAIDEYKKKQREIALQQEEIARRSRY